MLCWSGWRMYSGLWMALSLQFKDILWPSRASAYAERITDGVRRFKHPRWDVWGEKIPQAHPWGMSDTTGRSSKEGMVSGSCEDMIWTVVMKRLLSAKEDREEGVQQLHMQECESLHDGLVSMTAWGKHVWWPPPRVSTFLRKWPFVLRRWCALRGRDDTVRAYTQLKNKLCLFRILKFDLTNDRTKTVILIWKCIRRVLNGSSINTIRREELADVESRSQQPRLANLLDNIDKLSLKGIS